MDRSERTKRIHEPAEAVEQPPEQQPFEQQKDARQPPREEELPKSKPRTRFPLRRDRIGGRRRSNR